MLDRPQTQELEKTKKSKLNRLIDSFHSLKLCHHHFQHQQRPTNPLVGLNSSIHTTPSHTTHTTPNNHNHSNIVFPVPKPFKHPPSSPARPDLSVPGTPSSSVCLAPSFVRPKPTQKPSAISQSSSTTKPPLQSPYTTPTKPSSPPSANNTPTAITRCSGTTREGKPCSRKPMKTMHSSPGKTPIHLNQKLDELDQILVTSLHTPTHILSESLVPRFCFQHYQKANAQSGAFFGKSIWIEYSDWFASELPEDVKITLKTEMSKQPTEKDKSEYGYLYCHEMRPSKEKKGTGTGTYIKVGRSTRPVARLGEWSKQCPSRTPIVRGFFPEFSSSNKSDQNHQSACYLDGIQTVSPQGIRFHRKWERLALVELAGWAFLQRQGSPKLPCTDCSKVHLELFELDRGSYERLVKPLILKWQKWCQFAYL